jgi:hypothetical protein
MTFVSPSWVTSIVTVPPGSFLVLKLATPTNTHHIAVAAPRKYTPAVGSVRSTSSGRGPPTQWSGYACENNATPSAMIAAPTTAAVRVRRSAGSTVITPRVTSGTPRPPRMPPSRRAAPEV